MNGREPRVTVVMITHNRRDEVLRTLEHMVALPDAAPIIVVDNASDDVQLLRFPTVTHRWN
ncbi:glycosyltransferase family 2 protein [Rhodococcus sp. NPDC060090]|uniref:glycosyltransferase family 2 protein n=1 Tax=Rhodococcus sp. NPDC060090 TaxID=3347056 RepID=UPI00365DFEAE